MINGWNGFYGAPPVMVVPTMSTPMRKAYGIEMPARPSANASSKGPKLKRWLEKIDQEETGMDSDASFDSDISIEVPTFQSYYGEMKAAGMYYVSDILHLTANELQISLKCTLIMAKRLLARAKAEMDTVQK